NGRVGSGGALHARLLRLRRKRVRRQRASGKIRLVAFRMPLSGDSDGDRIADAGLGGETGEEIDIGTGTICWKRRPGLPPRTRRFPIRIRGGSPGSVPSSVTVVVTSSFSIQVSSA